MGGSGPTARPATAKVAALDEQPRAYVLNGILVRAILPVAAIGVAALPPGVAWAHSISCRCPIRGRSCSAVLALDLAIYLQHLMFHAVPLLWRLHRVHHADLDFDVTTGARFHPVEIVLRC